MFAGAMPMVTFQKARDFLNGLRPKTFEQVMGELQQVRSGLRIVEVARALGFANHRFEEREELRTLAVVFDFDTYADTVVNLVGELFPINLEAMYEMVRDDTGFNELIIEPAGMNSFSDEELQELIQDPECWTAGMSLTIFVFYLFQIEHIWEEAWDEAAEHFGWQDVPFPEDTQGNNYLDVDRLRDLLQQAGMEPFMGCLQNGFYGDNPFFVWRPFDHYDNLISPMSFDLETVRRLQEQWNAAQAILEQERQAERMAEEDPGCYARFLECWRASLRKRVEVEL